MEAIAEQRGRVGGGELPLSVAHRWDSSERPGTALPTCAGSPSPTRVLVVDDDPDLRALLSRLLENEPCTTPSGAVVPIVPAENGRVALAALLADPQTRWVILLDLRMPEVDGMQVWKRIATDATLAARCAVALVTAEDLGTITAWQQHAGAPPLPTVFPKPYEMEPVLDWVARHLALLEDGSAEPNKGALACVSSAEAGHGVT